MDTCPGGDDRIDSNGDGVPDDCEVSQCDVCPPGPQGATGSVGPQGPAGTTDTAILESLQAVLDDLTALLHCQSTVTLMQMGNAIHLKTHGPRSPKITMQARRIAALDLDLDQAIECAETVLGLPIETHHNGTDD